MHLSPMPNHHRKKRQNSSFLQKLQTMPREQVNKELARRLKFIEDGHTTYRYDVNLNDVDQLYDALETGQIYKIKSDPVGHQTTPKSDIFVETLKKNYLLQILIRLKLCLKLEMT